MKGTREAVKEKMSTVSAATKEVMEKAAIDARTTAKVLTHPTNK